MTAKPSGPLTGVRVLDLSRHLPGPYCSMMLADLGADVVKVEEPGPGDPVRWVAPRAGGESALFAALNRNKRSVAIDYRHDDGRNLVLELADRSDVLLETFRPGVMDRLGLGYDIVGARNPRLVYCSISGFGQDGPDRERAGHDLGYQARAGLLSLSPVAVPPVQVADLAGGAQPAIIAILAALLHRNATGRGQRIDVSMLEGTLALLPYSWSKLLGGEPPRLGATTELTGALPCYHVYRTQDGRHVALAALEPKFWRRFCRAVGHDELMKLQFVEGEERRRLFASLDEIFAARSWDQWRDLSRRHDMCLEPVLTLAEAIDQPATRERRFLATVPATSPPQPALGFPYRLSDSPPAILRPAPELGQHTAEVLRELGLAEDDVKRLERRGVTAARGVRRLAYRLLARLGWSAGVPLRRSLRRRRSTPSPPIGPTPR